MKSYLRSMARTHILVISLISLLLLAVPPLLSYYIDDLGTKAWGPVTGELICPKSQDYMCSALAWNTHYCEPIDWSKLLRTPYNGMSNMAFPISAMITLSTTSLHFRYQRMHTPSLKPTSHLQQYPPLNSLYAFLITMCGVGSFYCHSAITFDSAQWDRAGIWCIVAPGLGFTFLRFVPLASASLTFYRIFCLLVLVIFPLSLSLFHILDPENELATPLLVRTLLGVADAALLSCSAVLPPARASEASAE